jgi:ketosteroid isomerase-like protein
MSQENVEIVQQVYEAFARRDFAAVLGLCSGDFELDITAHPMRDLAHVWTLDAGRIVRLEAFQAAGEALKAAGLSE